MPKALWRSANLCYLSTLAGFQKGLDLRIFSKALHLLIIQELYLIPVIVDQAQKAHIISLISPKLMEGLAGHFYEVTRFHIVNLIAQEALTMTAEDHDHVGMFMPF